MLRAPFDTHRPDPPPWAPCLQVSVSLGMGLRCLQFSGAPAGRRYRDIAKPDGAPVSRSRVFPGSGCLRARCLRTTCKHFEVDDIFSSHAILPSRIA